MQRPPEPIIEWAIKHAIQSMIDDDWHDTWLCHEDDQYAVNVWFDPDADYDEPQVAVYPIDDMPTYDDPDYRWINSEDFYSLKREDFPRDLRAGFAAQWRLRKQFAER